MSTHISDRINKLNNVLSQIPRDSSQFNLDSQEQNIMSLTEFILEKEDALELTSIIYEEIDHYNLRVNITVQRSQNCVVFTTFIITFLGGVVGGLTTEYSKRGIDRLCQRLKRFFNKKLNDEKLQIQ